MLNVLTKKTYILFIVTLFVSQFSLAQKGGGGSAPKFSFGLMALGGTGKMGNGLADAPDRDMFYTPVGLFAGFNLKKFRIGLNYEYMIAGQTTEPSTVANTNLSGTGTSPGLRLEYYDGKNAFGIVYRVSDSFTLDKVTFAGAKATYKGSGGISIQYMRQLKNKIGLVVDYTTETFSDSLSTGNVKWSRMGLGIVFSNFSGGR